MERRASRLILISILVAAVQSSHSYPQQSSPQVSRSASDRLSREVSMGIAGPIRLESSSVLFTGMLSANDFFEGLQATQTDSGRRFSKGSSVVTEFPSSLTVRLDARVSEEETHRPQNEDTARVLLSHLRLTAKWKTGLVLRDVQSADWSFHRPTNEEWMARDDVKKLSNLGLRPPDPINQGLWTIDVRIKDDHVPLTDSLVIVIECEKKFAARLSARL
jgi:hypothetical protein